MRLCGTAKTMQSVCFQSLVKRTNRIIKNNAAIAEVLATQE
jgi:hypothetical protein